MSIQKVSTSRTDVGERHVEVGEIEKSIPVAPNERISVKALSPAELAASLSNGQAGNNIAGNLIGIYIGADFSWKNRAFNQDSLLVVEQLMRYFSERTGSLSESDKPAVIPAFQIANRQWQLRRRWQQMRTNDVKETTVTAEEAEAIKAKANTVPAAKTAPAESGLPAKPPVAADTASMRMIATGLLWGFVNAGSFQEAYDFATGCRLLWPEDATLPLLHAYAATELGKPLDNRMRDALGQVRSPEIRSMLHRRASLDTSS